MDSFLTDKIEKMNDNDLKGKIACELIIEATETKGKRPTQLNFDELIDVVTGVVKKLSIPRVVGRSEQLKCHHQYVNAGTLQGDAMKKCLKCGDYVKAL